MVFVLLFVLLRGVCDFVIVLFGLHIILMVCWLVMFGWFVIVGLFCFVGFAARCWILFTYCVYVLSLPLVTY